MAVTISYTNTTILPQTLRTPSSIEVHVKVSMIDFFLLARKVTVGSNLVWQRGLIIEAVLRINESNVNLTLQNLYEASEKGSIHISIIVHEQHVVWTRYTEGVCYRQIASLRKS